MNLTYLESNRDYYDSAYDEGYGIQYPESHIIRTYNKVLKNELGLPDTKRKRMLDFGCGNGTHARFFLDKGFDVHGMDISKAAIKLCKTIAPELTDRFLTIQPNPEDYPIIGNPFDVILSNQVLYFLSALDLRRTIEYLYKNMNPGGVLIATMMSTDNYYYQYARDERDGLHSVHLPNNKILHIHFTGSKEELIETFHPFQALHIGYYDAVISEHEGNGHHFLFIGQKTEQ